MDLHLILEGRRDLAGQLFRQLREAILAGRLAAGAKLPSTRELAAQLGVSRKTTLDAFDRLIAEGYLATRPGGGTYVAAGLAREAGPARAAVVRPLAPSPFWAGLPEALALPAGEALAPYDFRGGVTDKRLFPFAAWRRCLETALAAQVRRRSGYLDPAGDPSLRSEIARYLAFSRAVACARDEVVVTQGAQQAIDLLARVMLRPGDVVALESPGYPPVRASFAAQGAVLADVPVDGEGLVVERLPDNARLVYVTPSHQFPWGMSMSLERRLALLDWAGRRDALVIEDDYDGEFRFAGRPLDALKSLDRAGRVAYVGTFSKTLFPDLRIGYAVPPPSLVGALRKARQVGDWHGCALTQAALAAFMAEGHFARHLRRARKHYADRRARLLTHLRGPLSPWLEALEPAAGIHLAARLAPGHDEATLIAAARPAGISLYGVSAFYAGQPPVSGLLFGYGGIAAGDIDAALAQLAEVWGRLG